MTETHTLHIVARDVRRERTGIHAQVRLRINNGGLAYDTFNVTRQEDRTRLARSAHGQFRNGLESEYPLDFMKHDLDEFCQALEELYDEGRFELCHYDADEDVPKVKEIVRNLVLEGAGTIIFAPPDSGKSYTLMAIAGAVATGNCNIWEVERRDVLYVNIERSAVSMRRRFKMVAAALGIKGKNHQLEFLQAKGMPFTSIARKITRWKVDHPQGILAVDSISRAGYGSLNEDEVANKIIDYLNGYGTWIAIGHTPRADSDHIFGSIHFDAGEDVGVKLSRDDKPDGTLGISMEVVKANDMAKPPIAYIGLVFNKDGLQTIRRASIKEFPKLIEAKKQSNTDKVCAYLAEVGKASATKIAEMTKVPRSKVSLFLNTSELFVSLGRDGREAMYGLKRDQEDEVLPF